MMQEHGEPRQRGRPRSFETTAALDAAVRLFWAAGFEGASIERLARETGMPRATLYQIHGDKEGLFLDAVAHYAETRTAVVAAALGPKGPLHADLAAFLASAVDLATSEPEAPGCLISCVLADAAGANPRFRAELDARFGALESRIADRLRHDAGPGAGDPQARALLIAAVVRGLMVRARTGAGRDVLDRIAAEALALLAPLPN